MIKRRTLILSASGSISAIAVPNIFSSIQKSEAAPAIPEQFRIIQQRIQQHIQQAPHTRIDPKRSALLLIEFQGEWLSPKERLSPLLQDRQQVENAVQNATLALQVARKLGMNVIHAGMVFQPGHPEIAGGYYGLRGIQPITNVFVAGTPGSQFVAPFAPSQG